MASELLEPKLKHADCVEMSSNEKPFTKRYVIENEEDLKKFIKVFDKMNLKESFIDPITKIVERGGVVLLSDPHGMSGFNTYCTEHHEDLIRVDSL